MKEIAICIFFWPFKSINESIEFQKHLLPDISSHYLSQLGTYLDTTLVWEQHELMRNLLKLFKIMKSVSEQHQWSCHSTSIVKFEQFLYIAIVPLYLAY